MYNQWCEGVYYMGVTGARSKGLQIIFPLSPKCALFLFDRKTYSVLGSPFSTIELHNVEDVREFNKLQIVFADENIYLLNFGESVDIINQVKEARKFHKEWESTVVNSISDEDGGSELIHSYGGTNL